MPRRARCRSCLVTHVLLPVVMFSRRGYSAAVIVSALAGKAAGCGYRPIAERLGVPAGTVRGWLRRMAGRLEAARKVFVAAAIALAPGLIPPVDDSGPWPGMLAGLGMAVSGLRGRFPGPDSVVMVTGSVVACALSNGCLLAPGWPQDAAGVAATRVVPVVAGL